jgi:methionyl-tRNA synthetase
MELSFKDWQNVDLRVGLIEKVEDVSGKEKLYKFTVSFGTDKRTSVAGVRQFYKPGDLAGKKAAFVYNLAPATIGGVISNAMVLAVQAPDNSYKVVFVDGSVKEGTRLE